MRLLGLTLKEKGRSIGIKTVFDIDTHIDIDTAIVSSFFIVVPQDHVSLCLSLSVCISLSLSFHSTTNSKLQY